jgi:hypothetical protein
MSKTVKISFDENDPLYQFLVQYGARFGHGGASITARLLLDAAFQSQPPNPFGVTATLQLQPASKIDKDGLDVNNGTLELPAEPSALDSRQTLLGAISEFQNSL